MEVSRETVRLGTCGAEAILLWLREGLLTLEASAVLEAAEAAEAAAAEVDEAAEVAGDCCWPLC